VSIHGFDYVQYLREFKNKLLELEVLMVLFVSRELGDE
jgi:hypothetical protein